MIEFEIDGVSYELMFMIAPNVVPDAILRINFLKENNVVMNLNEGRFRTRRDGFNLNIGSSMIRCRRTKWESGTLYRTRKFN